MDSKNNKVKESPGCEPRKASAVLPYIFGCCNYGARPGTNVVQRSAHAPQPNSLRVRKGAAENAKRRKAGDSTFQPDLTEQRRYGSHL
jgi:hypothetical protein